MKMNFDKLNKKQKKEELKQIKKVIATTTHADYEKKLESVDAPFGKTFKTGGHKSDAVYKRDKRIDY